MANIPLTEDAKNDLLDSYRRQYALDKETIKELEEARMMQWQPIETAPRDKTMVALLHVGAKGYWRYGVGWFMPQAGWQGWNSEDHKFPTHWMPLPEPPEEASP